MNQVHNVLDTLLIMFIIGSIIRAPKGQMGKQNVGQEKKKFDVIKNVNIKFSDVAGLQETKREVQ